MMEEEIRKHIRFYPEPLEIAFIDTDEGRYNAYDKSNPDLKTEYVALIENESHNGATLVFVIRENNTNLENHLKPGKNLLVKLGKLTPLRAEVKWTKALDQTVLKTGISIID